MVVGNCSCIVHMIDRSFLAHSSVHLPDWLDYIQGLHTQMMDLGLERVREVANRLDITSRQIAKRTIVVGGTNGKGSTVAYISHIAKAAGLRVGSYTSPHLRKFNERVCINCTPADDALLVRSFAAVDRVREDTPLTYFEFSTLAAFWMFSQSSLDLAVLEVGLGGRLDAVNIIDADASIITTVDIDHADILGEDRETIAKEKTGIIRMGRPVVVGDYDPPSAVLTEAYRLGATLLRVGNTFFCEPQLNGKWRWRDAGFSMLLPTPGLFGPVQLVNAAVAIAALRALPLPISRAAFANGLANTSLSGRFQTITLEEGVQIILDVCHNPQAANALGKALEQLPPISGKNLAVFSALADKDAYGIGLALRSIVSDWYLAGLAVERGQTAQSLYTQLAPLGLRAHCFEDVHSAFAAARQDATQEDRIIVFGSFHTISQIMP